MKRVFFVLITCVLSLLNSFAQTKADSIRADSIFKSLELQGVEIVKRSHS